MKLINILVLVFFFSSHLFGQDDKIQELVSQGTELHDQGKYDEAIIKYKSALELDKNSTLANYELSYTYMTIGKYPDAIKFSKKVIEQNSDNQHGAYLVLGSSLDLNGKPKDAIKVYEEGLNKFPDSNLLNYNIALTLYNLKDYNNAEQYAIKAIISRPPHGSSHLILAGIMHIKGERVKELLPLYYFLMLEPNSKRSLNNLKTLKNLLNKGVEVQADNKINVNVPTSATNDSIWGAAEMMVSLLGASKYTEENKGRSEMAIFVETNRGLFSLLGEIKKYNSDLWWDLYVTKFNDLIQSNNIEAFSYYISQSENSPEVNNWIALNKDKMQLFIDWMKK
jgi:tetratricopeptide (TPR) repeat protein